MFQHFSKSHVHKLLYLSGREGEGFSWPSVQPQPWYPVSSEEGKGVRGTGQNWATAKEYQVPQCFN